MGVISPIHENKEREAAHFCCSFFTAPASFNLRLSQKPVLLDYLSCPGRPRTRCLLMHRKLQMCRCSCAPWYSGYGLRDACTHISQLWHTTFSSPGCLGLLTPKGCIETSFSCLIGKVRQAFLLGCFLGFFLWGFFVGLFCWFFFWLVGFFSSISI